MHKYIVVQEDISMNINLAEQLKALRKEKNISQEKLATYLGISYQAISKWENGNAYPDIQLLPNIARFFGITIDELLQVEKLDEQALLEEYTAKTEALFRNGEAPARIKSAAKPSPPSTCGSPSPMTNRL